jgi:hypothetical protein
MGKSIGRSRSWTNWPISWTLKRGVRRTGNCSKRCEPFETYITRNRCLYSQLRRTVPAGKNHLDRVRRIGRQQVVSKRFVKKQQMRWSERGAHLLLQIRAQVLNGDWRPTLSRWYPRMKIMPEMKTDRLAGKLGLSPSRVLSREETLKLIPTLEPAGLQRGCLITMGSSTIRVWP